MNTKNMCVSVLVSTGVFLACGMQGCSLTGTRDGDQKADPGKVVELHIYDADLGDTSSLTLEASGSSQCEQAIRDIKAKDYESAKRNLNELLEKNEKDFKAWFALGALHERDGDYASAFKCYQNAVKTDKKGNNIYGDAVDRVIDR